MSRRATKPPGGPGARRDRLMDEPDHDPYKLRGKLPDPTACPDCGAMYRDGRWMRGAPPAGAHEAVCPACQRIRDDYPAGVLRLSGPFPQEHRDEILGLARNVAEREGGEHPLKRIMAVKDEDDEIVVTTTDSGLARNIGDALQSAYEGELDYRYSDGEDVLRVSWKR